MPYKNFEFIYDLLSASALGISQALKDSLKESEAELKSNIVDDKGWGNASIEIFMFLISQIDYEMYGFEQKDKIREDLLSYLTDKAINNAVLDSVKNDFKKVLYDNQPIVNKLKLIPVQIDFKIILRQRMYEYGCKFEEYSKNKDTKSFAEPFLQNILWATSEKAVLDWEDYETKPVFLDTIESFPIKTVYLRSGYKFHLSLYICLRNILKDNNDFTELNNSEMVKREESAHIELENLF